MRLRRRPPAWSEEMTDFRGKASKPVGTHVLTQGLANEILLRPACLLSERPQALGLDIGHSNIHSHRVTLPKSVPTRHGPRGQCIGHARRWTERPVSVPQSTKRCGRHPDHHGVADNPGPSILVWLSSRSPVTSTCPTNWRRCYSSHRGHAETLLSRIDRDRLVRRRWVIHASL